MQIVTPQQLIDEELNQRLNTPLRKTFSDSARKSSLLARHKKAMGDLDSAIKQHGHESRQALKADKKVVAVERKIKEAKAQEYAEGSQGERGAKPTAGNRATKEARAYLDGSTGEKGSQRSPGQRAARPDPSKDGSKIAVRANQRAKLRNLVE